MYKFLILSCNKDNSHIHETYSWTFFARRLYSFCVIDPNRKTAASYVVLPRLKLLSSTNLRNSSGIPWIFGWNTFGGAVSTTIRKFAWTGLSGWTSPFFGGLPEPRTLLAPFSSPVWRMLQCTHIVSEWLCGPETWRRLYWSHRRYASSGYEQ